MARMPYSLCLSENWNCSSSKWFPFFFKERSSSFFSTVFCSLPQIHLLRSTRWFGFLRYKQANEWGKLRKHALISHFCVLSFLSFFFLHSRLKFFFLTHKTGEKRCVEVSRSHSHFIYISFHFFSFSLPTCPVAGGSCLSILLDNSAYTPFHKRRNKEEARQGSLPTAPVTEPTVSPHSSFLCSRFRTGSLPDEKEEISPWWFMPFDGKNLGILWSRTNQTKNNENDIYSLLRHAHNRKKEKAYFVLFLPPPSFVGFPFPCSPFFRFADFFSLVLMLSFFFM